MAIGIYYKFTGGKQRTTSEYLLADSSMDVLPVAFSLMASFMSAITLLGVSAEIYTYGTQFVVINIAYIIGTPIAAFVFLPVFYRLKLTSIYQVCKPGFETFIMTYLCNHTPNSISKCASTDRCEPLPRPSSWFK